MTFSKILAIGSALLALSLGGCAFLPGSGPESWDVHNNAPTALKYALVRIEPHALDVLSRHAPRLSTEFSNHSPPSEIHFGIGDMVGVTLFEAASGGLFIPAEAGVRPGNFITLPNQLVDGKGNISVPYAGAIHAAGRTQVQVQQSIVDAVKARAIEPQVVVSLIEQRATLISVLGDVNSPGRFPVNHAGERVLDAIAQGGGPKFQGFEEWVVLERNGHRAVQPFGALVWEPGSNIYVHPGDTLYLFHQPQTMLAFGATGTQGLFNFESWRMSLAEAIGKAGGLNDNAADAASVFLYRGETVEVARLLGVDVSLYDGPIIPVIYQLDLRDATGWLLARKFDMRNKDVIYVPNSVTVEATKAMAFFRMVVGTVNDPLVAAVNAKAIGSATSSTVNVVGGTTTTTGGATTP
jgi:polysaccharide export outer membrane protein